MSDGDEFEAALKAIAKMEGKSVEQVKLEMLKDRLGGAGREASRPESTALTRSELGDASGAIRRSRSEALATHNAQEFPGTPVVRHRLDHGNESAAEAEERWLEEEAELVDGVHGLGGSSAGGIFGEGPIATNIYDPMAEHRAENRVSQAASIRTMRLLERMEQRLDRIEGAAPNAQLPQAGSRRRLGRGNR